MLISRICCHSMTILKSVDSPGQSDRLKYFQRSVPLMRDSSLLNHDWEFGMTLGTKRNKLHSIHATVSCQVCRLSWAVNATLALPCQLLQSCSVLLGGASPAWTNRGWYWVRSVQPNSVPWVVGQAAEHGLELRHSPLNNSQIHRVSKDSKDQGTTVS